MNNDLGKARPLRGSLLAIGILAVFLLGYVLFSGPLSSAPIPDGSDAAVELAKEELAARKGIDTGEITVVAVTEVNWQDTSLGCPEPGMVYAQVITPGYRILLSWEGQTYECHSDLGERVVYCG